MWGRMAFCERLAIGLPVAVPREFSEQAAGRFARNRPRVTNPLLRSFPTTGQIGGAGTLAGSRSPDRLGRRNWAFYVPGQADGASAAGQGTRPTKTTWHWVTSPPYNRQ